MRLVLALLTSLLAEAGPPPAGGMLPNGTYHYEIRLGSGAIGSSTILVRRAAGSVEIDENGELLGQSLASRRSLAATTLRTLSYSGEAGGKHFNVSIEGDQASLLAGTLIKRISAAPDAPWVVNENMVAGFAQMPAMVQEMGEKRFTLACICGGGFSAVPVVATAAAMVRPVDVPDGDASATLMMAGVGATLWFDPHTYVLDRLEIPSKSFSVVLQSYDAALSAPPKVVSPTPLPLPPARYSSRDVSIVADDGVRLAGTLTIPDAPTPLGSFVFVHGSGCSDRDETIGPNKIFAQLANRLSNDGYAVLRYDKRSCGRSGGTFPVRNRLIADARDAIAYLRVQRGVDPNRIFVLGHSEGGGLAPSIAIEDGRLRGIVLLAPPAIPLEKILMQQALHFATDANRAAVAKREQAQLDAIAAGKGSGPQVRWLRSSFGIDPAAAIARVPCPILILQGTEDFQVRPSDTPRLVEAARSANRNVTLIVLPGDDHLFIPVPPQRSSTLEEYFTPAYLDPALFLAIEDWLKKIAEPSTPHSFTA